MSTTAQEKLLQSLTKENDLIENEIIKISELAAEISQKFQGLSNNIQNLSSIVGLFAGRKSGNTTALIGGAVGIIGDIYAGIKEDEAIAKLAPKKLELAKVKSETISNFRERLDSQNEKYWELLKIEAVREFEVEKLEDFVNLHGEDCQNTFHLYVMNFYLMQVCDYILEQFNSWKLTNGLKDDNTSVKPDKTYVLEHILNSLILPNISLKEALSGSTSDGATWLLTTNESLFAIHLQKIINDSTTKDELDKKRVFKKSSFINFKKYIQNLKSNENSENFKWLIDSKIYLEAKSVTKIPSLNFYLLKYFFVGMMCFNIYNGWSNPGNSLKDFILYVPILSLIFALPLIPCAKFILWASTSEEKSIYYYLMYLFFTIITLGLMPIALYRYQKKEEDYYAFLNELNLVQKG
ncbi:MAG: hypothetical protein ABIQ27_03325 [Flavobacterium sp.]|uniref:hypothetical protein n=1 Tax=Flavobacterium sp. TaxID=239 RepID=UPI0032645B7C